MRRAGLSASAEVLVPDVLACFRAALTFRVSSASAERSVSALRRIKDHLRGSMTDSRVSDLAVYII